MDKDNSSKKIAELEALLFYHGEPLKTKKIAEVLNLKENECDELINQLMENLKEDKKRGLLLIKNDDKIQLGTKPEFQKINQQFLKEEFNEQLTPAALETLSIVAYLGPIPRMTVDFIRGVNSSFSLRNLMIRGLVERNPAGKGNIYHYQVSFDFLKHIGLNNREQLPDFEKYKDILKTYEVQSQLN